MSKPCKGCDEMTEKELKAYVKGKIPLRFKRSGRKVGLLNYEDGKVYWMHPRHAAYPWFDPVVNWKGPVVVPPTKAVSVYTPTGSTGDFQRSITEDSSVDATIGESGYTLSSSGGIEGKFREPEESVDELAEIEMPNLPEKLTQEPVDEPKSLGFP